MAEEGTAKILVLIAAIIELVIFAYSVWQLVIFWQAALILLAIPFVGMMLFLTLIGMWLFLMPIGLIFMILWFLWYRNPGKHKTALIITGIIGIFGGGLFALIGGVIAPKSG